MFFFTNMQYGGKLICKKDPMTYWTCQMLLNICHATGFAMDNKHIPNNRSYKALKNEK